MKVYIAVGHGIQPNGVFDPGAVAGGVTEQSSGDVIVKEAARLCRNAGLDVLDEAYTDDPNFVGTVAAANRWGADLLVAVHHDWSGGVRAHGFWYPGSTQGEKLCRTIIGRMKAGGVTVEDRWVRGRDLYLLRESAMPSVLMEVGRVGQPEIDTDAERLAMGRYIAEGIVAHAGASIPVEVETQPEDRQWQYPDHAEGLLDAGVYTKWTRPGVDVDTDNLSAYLDRLLALSQQRDDQLSARVRELERMVRDLGGS